MSQPRYGIMIQEQKTGEWFPYAPETYNYTFMARAEVEAAQLEGYFPGTKFKAVVLPAPPEGVIHEERFV